MVPNSLGELFTPCVVGVKDRPVAMMERLRDTAAHLRRMESCLLVWLPSGWVQHNVGCSCLAV